VQSNEPILAVASLLTQEAAAVKQLIEFVTGKPCRELPATFALANGARLTRSRKGDVFYMTTPTACSCPARACNPGQACKRMNALNSREASRAQPRTFQAGQVEVMGKGGSLQMDSIRPAGMWPGGLNGPVDSSELKVVV